MHRKQMPVTIVTVWPLILWPPCLWTAIYVPPTPSAINQQGILRRFSSVILWLRRAKLQRLKIHVRESNLNFSYSLRIRRMGHCGSVVGGCHRVMNSCGECHSNNVRTRSAWMRIIEPLTAFSADELNMVVSRVVPLEQVEWTGCLCRCRKCRRQSSSFQLLWLPSESLRLNGQSL